MLCGVCTFKLKTFYSSLNLHLNCNGFSSGSCTYSVDWIDHLLHTYQFQMAIISSSIGDMSSLRELFRCILMVISCPRLTLVVVGILIPPLVPLQIVYALKCSGCFILDLDACRSWNSFWPSKMRWNLSRSWTTFCHHMACKCVNSLLYDMYKMVSQLDKAYFLTVLSYWKTHTPLGTFLRIEAPRCMVGWHNGKVFPILPTKQCPAYLGHTSTRKIWKFEL